jgi:hypothetical protein
MHSVRTVLLGVILGHVSLLPLIFGNVFGAIGDFVQTAIEGCWIEI